MEKKIASHGLNIQGTEGKSDSDQKSALTPVSDDPHPLEGRNDKIYTILISLKHLIETRATSLVQTLIIRPRVFTLHR